MATLEMVEKLKERANVSYDEAKTALEATGDDLLEALIYLERQGKTATPQSGGYYSTKMEVVQGGGGQNRRQDTGREYGESFGQMLRRFWRWFCRTVDKGNVNSFEVWKADKRILSVPVTVLVVFIIFCFWIVIPLLVVGLFLGCKYRFRGPELSDSQVNNVMDSAAKVADSIKSEVLHTDGRQNGSGEQ